jgi:hypothetical protein
MMRGQIFIAVCWLKPMDYLLEEDQLLLPMKIMI